MNDPLPQRFQWKDHSDGPWRNGVTMPNGSGYWTILAGSGFENFDDDPWETMGHIIGDATDFRWIDNDYGWHT